MELRAVGLECIRGDRLLFSALSFGLPNGRILFIEGANGAGKTSLLRILAGLSPPGDGEVLWCSQNIRQCRAEFCTDMIYLGHATGLKAELSPLENLRIWSRLAGLTTPDATIRHALSELGLAGSEETSTRTLSAGQRQRTALARLLLSPASCWILDEPFTALDADGILRVRALLESHAARGGMAVLTSHQTIPLTDNMSKLVLS